MQINNRDFIQKFYRYGVSFHMLSFILNNIILFFYNFLYIFIFFFLKYHFAIFYILTILHRHTTVCHCLSFGLIRSMKRIVE